MSAVAFVAWARDPLAEALKLRVEGLGQSTLWLEPHALAERRVTLASDKLRVDGHDVSAVFWRVPPDAHYSSGFAESDQQFADVETRSFWLAALHCRTLRAPFSPEASAFFTGTGWPVWRQCLRGAGIPVSPLSYGTPRDEGHWLPYHHALLRPRPPAQAAVLLGAAITRRPAKSRVLLAGGEAIAIDENPIPSSTGAVAQALGARGVSLARVDFDDHEAVLAVDPFPVLTDPDVVSKAAQVLAEVLDVPAHRR